MAAKTSKLNLKPMAGYVIVKPADKVTKTDSGIYLPDSSDEKPQKGLVIAVGEAETTKSGKKKPIPVKAGDVVIYKKWGGSEVKIDGVEYLFAKFEDILAIETK